MLNKDKLTIKPPKSPIRRCPATILAVSRTDKVTGRIKFLTSSTSTIKDISSPGVPTGTKWDTKDLKFVALKNTIKNPQKIKAILKEKRRCPVTVNTEGNRAKKLIIKMNKKKLIRNNNAPFLLLDLTTELNSSKTNMKPNNRLTKLPLASTKNPEKTSKVIRTPNQGLTKK
jgi:hypothetical protein